MNKWKTSELEILSGFYQILEGGSPAHQIFKLTCSSHIAPQMS